MACRPPPTMPVSRGGGPQHGGRLLWTNVARWSTAGNTSPSAGSSARHDLSLLPGIAGGPRPGGSARKTRAITRRNTIGHPGGSLPADPLYATANVQDGPIPKAATHMNWDDVGSAVDPVRCSRQWFESSKAVSLRGFLPTSTWTVCVGPPAGRSKTSTRQPRSRHLPSKRKGASSSEFVANLSG